jgi:hypothetical protein
MDYIDLKNPGAAGLYYASYAKEGIKRTLVQKHPELLRVPREADIQNEQAISKVLADNGWPWTPENLEAAYCVALQNGLLTLPEPGVTESNSDDIVIYSDELRQDADGKIVQRPATEQEVLHGMTTAQMRDYFEKTYQKPRPANVFEHFETPEQWQARVTRQRNQGSADQQAVNAFTEGMAGTK